MGCLVTAAIVLGRSTEGRDVRAGRADVRPGIWPLGGDALRLALGIGCFGAAVEITLNAGYVLGQAFGWTWGIDKKRRDVSRFVRLFVRAPSGGGGRDDRIRSAARHADFRRVDGRHHAAGGAAISRAHERRGIRRATHQRPDWERLPRQLTILGALMAIVVIPLEILEADDGRRSGRARQERRRSEWTRNGPGRRHSAGRRARPARSSRGHRHWPRCARPSTAAFVGRLVRRMEQWCGLDRNRPRRSTSLRSTAWRRRSRYVSRSARPLLTPRTAPAGMGAAAAGGPMSRTSLRLDRLVGRTVYAGNNRRVGRLEEFRAERRGTGWIISRVRCRDCRPSGTAGPWSAPHTWFRPPPWIRRPVESTRPGGRRSAAAHVFGVGSATRVNGM